MDWSNFIFRWQDLIGSGLGPFLAIILSGIAFLIKEKRGEMRDRKEAHRRIEIAVARSLNDAYILRAQLSWFASRIKALAAESRAEVAPNVYFLNRINVPSMREIYRDLDMARFKVRSYFIHNKLLFIDAGIKETNEVVAAFKNDFEEIIRQNGMLVALMSEHPNPLIQRQTYADNLDSYASELERYSKKGVDRGIKIMVQARVYNNLIRGKFGYWIWWKYEGTWMKYFWTKAEQKAFAKSLDSLDTIDAVIEPEVLKEQEKAEERGKKVFEDAEIN
jgi:hypothetical protein